MSGKSPTQRTMSELRRRGYQLVQVTEKWVPGANVRKDLFGFIDVLAVKVDPLKLMKRGKWGGELLPLDGGSEVLGVQACSGGGGDVAKRVRKIADSDEIHVLRLAGWSIAVWGWRKNSKGRYVLREVDLS